MKLYIDTTNNKKTIIKVDKAKYTKTYKSPKSQNLLKALDSALKKQNLSIKDITQIKVKTGPGHFTSLRVGVSVANALSYALGIPVNGNKSSNPVVPKYGKSPNISKPKNSDTLR